MAITSVALVAAVTIGGVWLAGRDGGSQPTNSSIAGAVEPSLTVHAVQTILEDPAIRTDPDIAPWLGVTIEDDDGTVYHYDGASWRAVTPGGDLWSLPGSTAKIIETQDEVRVTEVAGEEIGWVREVLDNTPGLSRDGEIYVIDDFVLYRDGLIEASAERGILGVEFGPGAISMSKPQLTSFVWVEPGDDYVWFIDDTAAVLTVAAGEELAVAGRLVPDGISGAVWEPAPNTETLSGSVSQVFASVDGAVEQGGRRKIPFKVFVPGEVPPIRVDKIPTSGGPTVTVRKYKPPEKECSWWRCFKDKVGGAADSVGSGIATGFERGWDSTANLTGKALDKIDLTKVDCATLVLGGSACALAVTEGAVDVTTAVLEVRGNIFAEKDCGSAGPHPPGGVEARLYPRSGYSLDSIKTLVTTDWPDQLDLARRWMPLIELSQDEQCGEILRVFAKVHAYTPQGGKAASIAETDRIEIAYTLFFKTDGGRFVLLGKDHPGDNEGFVIGLVRTEQRIGLCSTGFEFAGGRTVAHSDVGGAVVRYFEINKRQIDDFGPADVGTACPDPDASNRNDPWRILVAEGKHATYYHRDGNQQPLEDIPFPNSNDDPNGTNCEAALFPNLPVIAATLLTGSPEAALGADFLLKLAPPKVKANLQNGLEECEAGRDLLDLSSLVELYAEDLAAGNAGTLGFNDTYETEGGWKTYAEQARGRWCYGPKITGATPRRPDCNGYDFHVPGLFDTPVAEIGATVPPIVNLTEDEAREAVEAKGLKLVVTSQWVDHPNAAGRVLTQAPEAGAQVAPGSEVHVRVGVYSEVSVPDVIGFTSDGARSSIEAQDLVYAFGGTVELSPANASFDGLVVEQDPPAGTKAVPGTRVRVYVGSYEGPASVPVPDVFGQSATAVRSQIESLGLRYAYGGEVTVSDSGLDGVVVDQEPRAGTSLSEGGTVTVFVGVYVPQQVAVPDLGGLTESAARDRVEEAGLVLQVAGMLETSDSMVGRVVDQDPISGTVAVGSTIRVWIGVVTPTVPPPSFPPQRTSSWVSVSISGGHGSVHRIGDQVDVCFTWSQLSGEPAGQWQLWDFQPPESSGVMLDEGYMLSAGSDCFSATITGPVGYEEIVVVALEYKHATSSWQVKDWANVMIYVTD